MVFARRGGPLMGGMISFDFGLHLFTHGSHGSTLCVAIALIALRDSPPLGVIEDENQAITAEARGKLRWHYGHR